MSSRRLSGQTAGAGVPPRCCDCAASRSRCSSPASCPCLATKRSCDEQCESGQFLGDCLNQAVCKCSCENSQAMGTSAMTASSDEVTSAMASGKSPVSTSSAANNAALFGGGVSGKKAICSKPERCECVRMKEACSKLCACRQICKNRDVKKLPPKIDKPKQQCSCSVRGKRQCIKKECTCRGIYEFCSKSCKCQGNCTNSASKFTLSKHIQHTFLEHKPDSSGLVLTLIGDDYVYRTDFYHGGSSAKEPHVEEQVTNLLHDLISKYNVDLYEILIYVSKSPCFHQDCEPSCEVIDECKSNKACAKLLGLLLSKTRKEISKVDVRMTVKFLYPHLHRGDLYTKQGLLCMLQAGVTVEPLLMKDWGAIMDWAPHHADHHHNKGDYLQCWNTHNLDKAVAKSQCFVNECRRALGLPMKFWVAEIHEIVKNTIMHYSEIRQKLSELNDALKCLDLTATPHKIRSTPSKRRSFIDLLEIRDKILFRESRKECSNVSSNSLPADDVQAQQMVTSFCGRSFDGLETTDIAQRIRRATANINLEIESLMEYLALKGNQAA